MSEKFIDKLSQMYY